MGLIKTGMTLGAGYAMVKAATGAVEKHDQNRQRSQSPQPPYQQSQPQQFVPGSGRAVEGGQTYGKYIAPDGTEYPVYQPQPQFQQQYQQPQYQNQSREIGYQPQQPQYEQQSSRSVAQHKGGYVEPQATSTPPPYQPDRKSGQS